MAAKSRLNEEALAKLGLKKLSELVLDAAKNDAGFRRRVSAALAAEKGPDAVAAVIDRRLSALARARGFVDWEDAKTFASDLSSTVAIIAEELGKADPDAAIGRLIRFLGTAESVFERVDDSSGRIQVIYDQAGEALAGLVPSLTAKQKAKLPNLLHRLVVDCDYGFGAQLFGAVLPHLPDAAVDEWDARIVEESSALAAKKPREDDWGARSKSWVLVRMRQAVADRRGDVDAFIALEFGIGGRQPNTLAIAERLLGAGRHAEALEWVRKPTRPGLRILTRADLADGLSPLEHEGTKQVALELQILEAMGEREKAQELRWKNFLETLDAEILREHVNRLPDFEDIEVLDRAFAHAGSAKDKYRALAFFLSWPKLDLAARLIANNLAHWDGRNYWILAPAAETLEPDHPLAATILYRVLLDQILASARAKAYPHAARYLANLDAMAGRISGDTTIPSHATYKAELQKKHGRKSGFWALVKNPSLRATKPLISEF